MSHPSPNLNKEILALFSGQASTVTTPKLYIQLTGSHSLATVLNQCVFWSNKSKNKDGWFYKPYDEWFDEIHMPERTLRRRFDKLEEMGLIKTKVKKVGGLNTKHIYAHTDKIIESIMSILDPNCPNRPNVYSGAENEQKPCTKTAPTGQNGRSESANLAGSYIKEADDYLQKKLTNCSSSSFFSKALDKTILSTKLDRDARTDQEFMESVVKHVDTKSDIKYPRIVRAKAALKLLTKLKQDNIIFYVAGDEPKETPTKPKAAPKKSIWTDEEESLLADYKAGLKLDNPGMLFTKHPERMEIARKLYEKEQALKCEPKTNARKSSLSLASSLVSLQT